MLDTLLLSWLVAVCDFHKVEVPFAKAVCLLESRGDPNMETQKVAGLFGLQAKAARDRMVGVPEIYICGCAMHSILTGKSAVPI